MKSTKPQMITRAIPATGELLPVIGLGTWQAFDVASVPASLKPLGEVLRRFFAGGGRLIDSSPMYGQAEGVVGELLDAPHTRASAFIATKVWTSGREAGIAQMRRSFELFRTRVIDLMQIHNLLDWQTHLPTLRKMKDAGQIRYIGVTHYTDSALPALAEIIGREPLDFVQLAYSIDDREAERRVLSLAADHKVAVIANRPFGGGGMFTRVRGKSLPGWASDFGCASWADFFLKYIVSNPAVTCAIPATANPVHLSDNLEAGYGRLPDERERRRMAQLWDSM
ncbi:MAG TPA: aldo/keto reductase [Candidatus Binataceae bacterium]|nr:aldo/keto reductase [Candidatus Binataceae bacterium]